MNEFVCPNCGRTFYSKNDPARITCYDCGTSWNTYYEKEGSDLLALVATIILISIFPGIIIIGFIQAYFEDSPSIFTVIYNIFKEIL